MPDVGGTFTDVVVVDDADATLRFGKVLSTPDDPSRGSLTGAEETLARSGIAPALVGQMIHATTVATNAVLERTGSTTGLITTRGFRDTLEMRGLAPAPRTLRLRMTLYLVTDKL